MSKVIPFPTQPTESTVLAISTSGDLAIPNDQNRAISSARVTVADLFSADELSRFIGGLQSFRPAQAEEVVALCAEMMRQIECRRHNLPI